MKLKIGQSRTGAVIPLIWFDLFATFALHGKTVAAWVFGVICALSFAALIRGCWQDANRKGETP